ncbi:hypothetical protein BGZ76_002698 [Entomortierella beljakovae]|nr:hypothetical protein BGZ76_002698 [Entomortierella beljakovae]
MLRKIPPKNKKLLYPNGIPSRGVDVNAMFQVVNASIFHTVDGELALSITPPTTDTDSKSTKSTSSHQLSDEITSSQIIRAEFERNFTSCSGRSLTLNSKVDVDPDLFEVIRTFRDESLLHSFILDPEGLPWLLRRFHDGDSEELTKIVEGLNHSIKHTANIEDWKIQVINHFKTVYTMFCFEDGIACSPWREKLQMDTQNLRIKLLEGEISSMASALRRNAGRTLGDNQKAGHKIDVIFYVSRASDSEFGAIEAGKKNESSYGTKYLVDSVKLSNFLRTCTCQEQDWSFGC